MNHQALSNWLHKQLKRNQIKSYQAATRPTQLKPLSWEAPQL